MLNKIVPFEAELTLPLDTLSDAVRDVSVDAEKGMMVTLDPCDNISLGRLHALIEETDITVYYRSPYTGERKKI